MSIQPIANALIAGTPAVPSRTEAIQPKDVQPTAQLNQLTQRPLEPSQREPEQAEVVEATQRIKEFVKPINGAIEFSVDDESGRTIVKVVDLQTKEILRQIPSEEVLNIARALDKLQGLLIQGKA